MTLLETIPSDSPLRGLATELARQIQTKRDYVAPTPRIGFVDNDVEWLRGKGDPGSVGRGFAVELDVDGGLQHFGLTRYAAGQVAEHLGLPWKRFESLQEKHPDLLAHLANGLFEREPSTRLLRTMDGNVRAFLSDRYRPRDNWDLLDQVVLPVMGEHAGRVVFQRCDLTETRMYVKISLPDFEMPVTPKVGDVIHGGVIIQNSEVGSGSLVIAPYTTRLICTNGMVHTDMGQRQRHVGKRIEAAEEAWDLYSDETIRLDDAAFFAKCSDTLRAVLNETIFERIVSQMRELAEIHVPGAPDKVIEVLAKKHSLTDGEGGSMLAALIDEGDRSAWGYVNSLTRTARDHDSADRQVELETLAGRLTADAGWARSLAGAA